MKLSLCIVYIYLVTSMYMHLHEPSTIIAFRSSKNYHYWFLIIWLQLIFILFLSTIFKIFFAHDSDYLSSMPEWSWFHCIFLSHRITTLSSCTKSSLADSSASVFGNTFHCQLLICHECQRTFTLPILAFYAFSTGLMIFRLNHWMTIGIKWNCANRFCPSAWQFVL